MTDIVEIPPTGTAGVPITATWDKPIFALVTDWAFELVAVQDNPTGLDSSTSMQATISRKTFVFTINHPGTYHFEATSVPLGPSTFGKITIVETKSTGALAQKSFSSSHPPSPTANIVHPLVTSRSSASTSTSEVFSSTTNPDSSTNDTPPNPTMLMSGVGTLTSEEDVSTIVNKISAFGDPSSSGHSSSIGSSPTQIQGPSATNTSTNEPTTLVQRRLSKISPGTIAGLVVGATACFLAMIIGFMLYRRRQRIHKPLIQPEQVFPYRGITVAPQSVSGKGTVDSCIMGQSRERLDRQSREAELRYHTDSGWRPADTEVERNHVVDMPPRYYDAL